MGFFDGGTKGASYDPDQGFPMGTAWSGIITNVRDEVPLTEYQKPDKIKTYKSGKTIMQLPIEFQAEQVQPVEGDDGIRVLYFEGEKKRALILALRAAGVRRDPVPGDWFSLQWVAMGGDLGKRKMYTAQFVPNVKPQSAFFQAEQPAPVAAAAAAAPVAPAPPAAPTPVAHAAQVAATLQPPPAAPVPPPAPVAPAAPVAPVTEARPPWAPAPQPTPVGAPAAADEPPW